VSNYVFLLEFLLHTRRTWPSAGSRAVMRGPFIKEELANGAFVGICPCKSRSHFPSNKIAREPYPMKTSSWASRSAVPDCHHDSVCRLQVAVSGSYRSSTGRLQSETRSSCSFSPIPWTAPGNSALRKAAAGRLVCYYNETSPKRGRDYLAMFCLGRRSHSQVLDNVPNVPHAVTCEPFRLNFGDLAGKVKKGF